MSWSWRKVVSYKTFLLYYMNNKCILSERGFASQYKRKRIVHFQSHNQWWSAGFASKITWHFIHYAKCWLPSNVLCLYLYSKLIFWHIFLMLITETPFMTDQTPSLWASNPFGDIAVKTRRARGTLEENRKRGAAERKESMQRSPANFHFHSVNPGTPQSAKKDSANVPQIRKVTNACQV